MRPLLSLFLLVVLPSYTFSEGPRRFTFPADPTPLGKILRDFTRQTGVALLDERDLPDTPVQLDLKEVTFWQAADAISTAARAKVVPADHGALRLVRAGPGERPLPTVYPGEFRVQVSRITVTRDLDRENGTCTLAFQLTWTPGLRPLFVDSVVHETRIRDRRGAVVPGNEEGASLAPVDGRTSQSLEISFPALPRKDDRLAIVSGTMRVVAPSKFLTFRFDGDLVALHEAVPGGALRQLVQEQVVCRLERLLLARDRWSVVVALDYPPGSKQLESFQAGSLVVQNELRLVSKDGKRRLAPTGQAIERVGSRRALVTYHFTDRPGARRGQAADWKIEYTAPAKIIDLSVPFSFRDLPLP